VQGLKPKDLVDFIGPTEVVPFYKAGTSAFPMIQVFPIKRKAAIRWGLRPRLLVFNL
jgi:hypothetical protein